MKKKIGPPRAPAVLMTSDFSLAMVLKPFWSLGKERDFHPRD